MRTAVAPLTLVLLALLLTGCGGDEESSTDPASLEDVPWVVTSGIDVDGWEAAAPGATFEDGRVTGSTGCNRFGGQYTVDEGALELSAIASTQMACPPPADAVERVYLDALGRIAGWRVQGAELVLLDADDEDVLRYEAATPTGSWQGTGFLSESAFRTLIAGTEITVSFGDDGEVSGSAGCNTYTATYEAEVGTIEISQPAATFRSCAEPEGVMEQEAAYLEVFPTAASYRIDGGTLQLLSGDGTGIASYTRAP